MKTIRKIALASTLSFSFAVVTTTAIASNSGLPSSTNWQAWNQYVSAPTQRQSAGTSTGLPSSTSWQAWNRYMGGSDEGRYKFTQNSLPSSTNWQSWNEYVASTNN